MTEGQVQSLLTEIESGTLSSDAKGTLKDLVFFVIWLQKKLEYCQVSIRRLKRLFGFKTETQLNLFKTPSEDNDSSDSSKTSSKGKEPSKPKGHGKKGATDYPNAKTIFYPHESLKKGDRCPECQKGRLIGKDPGSILKLVGQAPIVAEVHKPERLRCSSCQEYFTAKVPDQVQDGDRLDPSAKSICALMKYGAGTPFNRLSNLQSTLGHPLPASTQWDAVEDVADAGLLPFLSMLRYGAENGKFFQNDDTGAKVLLLKKALKEANAERQGINTTGVLIKTETVEIAVYLTGNKNAGEHLDEVLQKGRCRIGSLYLMSDASAANLPEGVFSTFLVWGKCLDHSRRHFVDAVYEATNPDKRATYFIKMIAKVYKRDARSKSMSSSERLKYHKNHSLPVMEKLKRWARKMLKIKGVDKGSPLEKALKYYIRHYHELTAFTRVEGMPISNIDLERMLKVPILNRKNSYFYRTETGAKVADILMSLIETCKRAGGNPFEYLTEIQRNRLDVAANPDLWLPWNFTLRLEELKKGIAIAGSKVSAEESLAILSA